MKTIQAEIEEIPVNNILPNPNQPRKHFNEKAIAELAESIKRYGVIQPITVRNINNEYYELVSGERRLRAARVADLKTIPVIVAKMSEEDSAIIAIMENVQREDLTCFEEAESYRQLMRYYHLTQENIAKILGKSQSFIANKIRLLKLDPEVIKVVQDKHLSERHARALLRVPDKALQLDILKKVSERDYTVKKTELLVEQVRNQALVNNFNEKLTPQKKARVKGFINVQIYVNTIRSAFKMIKDSRKECEYKEIEKDDYVEIQIKIPK